MIITMKDLAEEAKVSLGTVSNVLNGKSGVSLEKIEKVQAAIEKLGYRKNIQAAQLKRGVSNRIAVVLPNIIDIKYGSFYESFNLICQNENLIPDLYLTYNQEEKERQIIKKIKEDNYLFIIIDSCLSDANDLFYEDITLSEKFIFIYREPLNVSSYIGFCYFDIIKDIINDLVKKSFKKLTVIKENYSDWSERDYAFLFSKAKEEKIKINLIEQQENIHKLAFEIAGDSNIENILIASFEYAKIVYNAFYFSAKKVPNIYTFYRNNFNNDNRFIQYSLDYDYIGYQIIKKIKNEKLSIKPKNFGFLDFDIYTKTDFKQINLLATPTPSIEALRKLVPHFKQLSGVDVNIETCSFSEIPAELEKNKQVQKYDLVRIDMESLPYFALDYLRPLDFLNEDMLKKHFSKTIIRNFCQFQNKLYAVPFDPSIQMLFYRKDLFEDTKIKRFFYERYKKNLGVPKDFEQFNLLAKFFQDDLGKAFGIEKGSALIIGDEATLASEFFVRYYALTNSVFRDEKLSLNKEMVKITLTQLKSLYETAILLEQGWWKDSVKLFEQSLIPMLIVYINHFSPLSDNMSTIPIGFAQVPNNRPLLGGGSLAILNQTSKQEICQKFLSWFLQNTIQEQYIQLGGISAKEDLIGNQSIIKYLPWLSLAKQTDFNGIRENTTSSNKAVNLRKIESIIGRAVKSYLLCNIGIEQTIKTINDELSTLN